MDDHYCKCGHEDYRHNFRPVSALDAAIAADPQKGDTWVMRAANCVQCGCRRYREREPWHNKEGEAVN